MASPIPARSDASSWLYECANCSFQIDASVQATPTCPNCNGPCVGVPCSHGESKNDSRND